MSNISMKDELKDVSAGEFSKRLSEYVRRIKKEKKVLIPNEPVGNINKSKVTDQINQIICHE